MDQTPKTYREETPDKLLHPFDSCEFETHDKTSTPSITLPKYRWKLDPTVLPTSDPSVPGMLWSSSGNIVLSGYTPPTDPVIPTVVRLATSDISSSTGGNVTLTLSSYESGGGSELNQGDVLEISWSGGDATYTHSKTTGGYSFKTLEGVSVDVDDLTGRGKGSIRIRCDHLNDTWWIIDAPMHVFDEWSFTSSNISFKNKRYINGEQITVVVDSNVRTTNTSSGLPSGAYVSLTYTITNCGFYSCDYINPLSTLEHNNFYIWLTVYKFTSTTSVAVKYMGFSTTSNGYPRFEVIGRYRE